eukprot:TRINITY_DN7864_c0_g1_i2.p2 TRINITY_DN7864_c0_g1~~TRINITY_DN7864_c0_g1_i2.p2  ORF type:complete len:144 (+),score=27.54 TRINITY_DN7864_c0_g1_i2:142-573(+)
MMKWGSVWNPVISTFKRDFLQGIPMVVVQLRRCYSKDTKETKVVSKGLLSKKEVQRVKGDTPAATRWLKRQLNDVFVHRAHAEGMISRAAYKLTWIDDKFNVLKRGGVVVDLGSAPGGWSKVAVQRTKFPFESREKLMVVLLV